MWGWVTARLLQMHQELQAADCQTHFSSSRVDITEKVEEGFDKSQSVLGAPWLRGTWTGLSILGTSYGSQFKSLASFSSSPACQPTQGSSFPALSLSLPICTTDIGPSQILKPTTRLGNGLWVRAWSRPPVSDTQSIEWVVAWWSWCWHAERNGEGNLDWQQEKIWTLDLKEWGECEHWGGLPGGG